MMELGVVIAFLHVMFLVNNQMLEQLIKISAGLQQIQSLQVIWQLPLLGSKVNSQDVLKTLVMDSAHVLLIGQLDLTVLAELLASVRAITKMIITL